MNRTRASKSVLFLSLFVIILLTITLLQPGPARAQEYNPNPPEAAVKLIFIHHSTGEAWLADEHGGLGLALGQNNYFVSDTNYGWGPDSIGDRTDIVNWPEWFRGPESARYLEAVFNESEQHSSYTRSLPDPGGENEIILFKSCFPNSNIEGSPTDPPESQGDALTVSNAKFIYNDLLNYFRTRPDKLFIVITAPPLGDANTSPEIAANARAFNNWLTDDWLREANYPYPNVAVFDFYNILTDPANHHRFNNGMIEHIIEQGGNTSYYPSDPSDDHPNAAGDQKATEEFLPLLNIFYHRWKTGAPVQVFPTQAIPTEGGQPAPTDIIPIVVPPPGGAIGGIDNFDGVPPAESNGWEFYFDPATNTAMQCAPNTTTAYNGPASLQINFDVVAGSWGTCGLYYHTVQDWRSGAGLSFFLHADQAGRTFSVNAYSGTTESLETYVYYMETPEESVSGWASINVPWDQLLRAEWESDQHNPFDPSRVAGVSFGFDGLADSRHTGTVWVDELHLIEPGLIAPAPTSAVETQPAGSQEQPTLMPATPVAQPETEGKPQVCGVAMALPMALVGAAALSRRRRTH